MAFVFELPEVGEGVVEAEIVKWHVAAGATVQRDQPLCEITTDKAQLEISSPRAGRVSRIFGKPGDIVKVHSPLVEFDDGTPAGATPPATDVPEPPPAHTPAPAAAPAAAPQRTEAPHPQPAATTQDRPPTQQPAARNPSSDPASRGATKAAPAVRRHARELDVDIGQVPGSGPGGRVTHDDLRSHASGQSEQPAQAREEQPLPKAPVAMPQVLPSGKEERIQIIGIRRKIAEQMVRAKQTAPHFTYVEEIDCTRLVELRERVKPLAEKRGVKLTYLPIFMKIVSIALREFPNVNAVMDEAKSELVVKGDHHFGIATDTPTGLMVPVIRNVEQKSVLRIAQDLADVTSRTRAGKAKLDELKGSTLTFTGVGNIGGVFATPILNVPEVAIIAINSIRPTPSVVDGQIVIRQKMFLSPSFDHRIIDGAVAARFVAAIKALIENPDILMLEMS